jgi:hypothetical protein
LINLSRTPVEPARSCSKAPEASRAHAYTGTRAFPGEGTTCPKTSQRTSVRRTADEGYREAILWVLAGNERARRFYEAAGWTLDGAQKTEHIGGAGAAAGAGTTVTEVRYRRTL